MDSQYLASYAEVDVQEISYIRFMLPKLDFGREDIEITSDYGPCLDHPDTITANIWARIGNSAIKGFICSLHIPADKVKKNGYSEIVLALNRDQDFHERLAAYLNWAEAKKN